MNRTRTLIACAVVAAVGAVVVRPGSWPVLAVTVIVLAATLARVARRARRGRRAADDAFAAFEREFWDYVQQRNRPRNRPTHRNPGD